MGSDSIEKIFNVCILAKIWESTKILRNINLIKLRKKIFEICRKIFVKSWCKLWLKRKRNFNKMFENLKRKFR